jgi:hypothetical protein
MQQEQFGKIGEPWPEFYSVGNKDSLQVRQIFESGSKPYYALNHIELQSVD